ncbi:MAG: hypothetical protein Q8L48_43745 [Archangium sp.]|nr:hypothetical protein [Archangium sp.]
MNTRTNEPKLLVPRTGWMLAAALVTAAVGLALLGAAALFPEAPLQWSAFALVGAALLEFAVGQRLSRSGGPGIAHTFAALLALGLASFLLAVLFVLPGARVPQPVALGVAVFCLANGLFRGLDVLIDRPMDSLAEAFDAVFTIVLGAVLVATWQSATPSFIAVVAGLELLVGGLAMAASAVAWGRHPDQPAYQDLEERLTRAEQLRPH